MSSDVLPSLHGVGDPVPPELPHHSISVSLPTWTAAIGYKERDLAVLDRLQSGYPRYWIHPCIRTLCQYFERQYGAPSERALIYRSSSAAKMCLAFMTARDAPARILDYPQDPAARPGAEVHVVLFPAEVFPTAKLFWQHTGLGISTRLADYYTQLLHVKVLSDDDVENIGNGSTNGDAVHVNQCDKDITRLAVSAKVEIRRRIADLLHAHDSDVFIQPGGMTAIYSAHQLCLSAIGEGKSICFGFPYADTLKILERWGPGAYFFPDGADKFLDELEKLLIENAAGSSPRIIALFTEFPSNPLLRSVNLPRLRQLADTYDFLIVVDDTVGNFANVNVMPFADIIVTSLSKLFSGGANVIGGSLVLNSAGRYYERLKSRLQDTYEDLYFDEDAIVLERNSREFIHRSAKIDATADAICSYLRTASPVITHVFYPKWQTPENFNACRAPGAGYGCLFSLRFASRAASQSFFNALPFVKGPSFGTTFTLVCPYAIIAHYYELDWAAKYEVPVDLIRVSVGLEDKDVLIKGFRDALEAAEEAHRLYGPQGELPQAIWKRISPGPTPETFLSSSACWE